MIKAWYYLFINQNVNMVVLVISTKNVNLILYLTIYSRMSVDHLKYFNKPINKNIAVDHLSYFYKVINNKEGKNNLKMLTVPV